MQSTPNTTGSGSDSVTGSELPLPLFPILRAVSALVALAQSGALTQTITPPESDDDFDNDHPIDADDPEERYPSGEFDG